MSTVFHTTPNGAATAPKSSFDLGRQFILMGGGVASTITVVLLNDWISNQISINLLSLSFWLVIPAGAIVGGMVAASGYYFAARATQTMPTRRLAWSMILIALCAWLLSHWLEYAAMTLSDGTRVQDMMDFGQFFRFTTEHQSLTIRTRGNLTGIDTGELGSLGYVRETLQVLGFTLGGMIVYSLLKDVESCEVCRRYAKVTTVMRGVSAEQFDAGLSHAGVTLPGIGSQLQNAVQGRRFIGMNLQVAQCPECQAFWVRPEAIVQSGRDPEAQKLDRYNMPPDLAGRVLGIPTAYRTRVKA